METTGSRIGRQLVSWTQRRMTWIKIKSKIPNRVGLIDGNRLVTQALPDYIRRVRDPYVDHRSSHRIPATKRPRFHCNLEKQRQYNSQQTDVGYYASHSPNLYKLLCFVASLCEPSSYANFATPKALCNTPRGALPVSNTDKEFRFMMRTFYTKVSQTD
ncbi:hypothetical protein U9M48_019348 [Paspalum notatum var. saurae]|uniref:Uncharacterized protein n=1 Tax=Paspalum notatum var. saurae TaxID=547442 RepID=A0AAQ3WR60_PASNO